MNNLQGGTSEDKALKTWSKEEKFYLLQGLKEFGSYDVEKLQEYVTTKDAEEISAALNYYKQKALKHPVFEKENPPERPKPVRKSRVPLVSWAKLLSDNLCFKELCTETSTAVRMIAELEDIPAPVCTDNVDFRMIYHQVANAMEGKSLVQDKIVTSVINKCIVETALTSKAFIKNSTLKFVVDSIDLTEREINVFPKPTEDQEVAILRHLASQRRYNPLNIQEHYLKPTFDTCFAPHDD